MSLLERVSNAQQTYSTHDAPRHNETHPNARTSDAALERFEELRSGVGSHLSSSDMGALITRNPLQARNEITQVCKRVCEERPWLAPTNRERDILINRYLDSVFGLGPLEKLLADERITEIMVNGSDALFYEADGVLYRSKNCFKNDSEVNALIDRIISPLGRRIDETSPMVNARLKQGHRVNAIIPPLSLDGPILTIRKFREQFFSLEDMRDLGSFDNDVLTFLRWAVQRRRNIAVSGGTGSGKTTLLNALSACIPPTERIITIEDSAELRFTTHPHVIRLEARPKNIEGFGEVTIKDLVINALRMRPDRIVVGECRGSEASRSARHAASHEYRTRWLAHHAPCQRAERGDQPPDHHGALRRRSSRRSDRTADRRSTRSGRSNEPRSSRQTLYHRDRRLLLQRSGKALRDEELF